MGIDYENLAKLTQKYIAYRPVIILGSGASIPHGLPSMSDLANRLLERIELNGTNWKLFKTELTKTKDLEKALQTVRLENSHLEQVVNETWDFANKQDLQAYENFLHKKTEFPLSRLFKYLLRTTNPKISVITTNYDRLAEYSANIAKGEVFTGFTAGWIQRFEPNISIGNVLHRDSIYEGQINILKVHGSLDWFGREGGESIAIPLAREIPESRIPLIVAPGISKYQEVHKDPFRTIIAQSDIVLKKASCFLCIGFGFNDEHVQPILVDRVRTDNIPIIIVTKNLTNATKTAFLETPPKKFIILEEAKNGTMVYCETQPLGGILSKYRLWELPNFLDMLLNEK